MDNFIESTPSSGNMLNNSSTESNIIIKTTEQTAFNEVMDSVDGSTNSFIGLEESHSLQTNDDEKNTVGTISACDDLKKICTFQNNEIRNEIFLNDVATNYEELSVNHTNNSLNENDCNIDSDPLSLLNTPNNLPIIKEEVDLHENHEEYVTNSLRNMNNIINTENDLKLINESITRNLTTRTSKRQKTTSHRISDLNINPKPSTSHQLSSNTIAPFIVQNSKKKRRDPFCWKCHKVGSHIGCSKCLKSFHKNCLATKCLNIMKFTCYECIDIENSKYLEKRSTARKFLNNGELNELLGFTLNRIMALPDIEPFMDSVNVNEFPDYLGLIVEPMYLNKLRLNIYQQMYKSVSAFVVDCKLILHNCIIFNTAQSKLTIVAKSVLRVCTEETKDILSCPECYKNANIFTASWFTEVCDPPHILLWAKLKGFPYWPSKVMTVKNSMVYVRFFGDHNKGWVPIKDCFLYCNENPNTNLKWKREEMLHALSEVEVYIANVKSRFGNFKPPPFGTLYDPTDCNILFKMFSYDEKNTLFQKNSNVALVKTPSKSATRTLKKNSMAAVVKTPSKSATRTLRKKKNSNVAVVKTRSISAIEVSKKNSMLAIEKTPSVAATRTINKQKKISEKFNSNHLQPKVLLQDTLKHGLSIRRKILSKSSKSLEAKTENTIHKQIQTDLFFKKPGPKSRTLNQKVTKKIKNSLQHEGPNKQQIRCQRSPEIPTNLQSNSCPQVSKQVFETEDIMLIDDDDDIKMEEDEQQNNSMLPKIVNVHSQYNAACVIENPLNEDNLKFTYQKNNIQDLNSKKKKSVTIPTSDSSTKTNEVIKNRYIIGPFTYIPCVMPPPLPLVNINAGIYPNQAANIFKEPNTSGPLINQLNNSTKSVNSSLLAIKTIGNNMSSNTYNGNFGPTINEMSESQYVAVKPPKTCDRFTQTKNTPVLIKNIISLPDEKISSSLKLSRSTSNVSHNDSNQSLLKEANSISNTQDRPLPDLGAMNEFFQTSSNKVTSFFQTLMSDMLESVNLKITTSETLIGQLKSQIEQMKLAHEQEIKEIKYITALQKIQMNNAFELEMKKSFLKCKKQQENMETLEQDIHKSIRSKPWCAQCLQLFDDSEPASANVDKNHKNTF